MFLSRTFLIGLALLIGVEGLRAQTETSREPSEIPKLIKDLGAPRFAVREAAKRKLWEAGLQAESVLREATKSSDAEVASSAKEILNKIEWGYLPGQTAEIRDLIDAFRVGDSAVRQDSIAALAKIRPLPFAVLSRILLKEQSVENSILQYSRLANELNPALFDAMLSGQEETALKYLELLAKGPDSGMQANYGALLKKRNRLPEAIAYWTQQENFSPIQKAAAPELLAGLYKLSGQENESLNWAGKIKSPSVRTTLLFHFNNWKILAKAELETFNPSTKLAFQAQSLLLAGDGKDAARKIEELLRSGEDLQDEQLLTNCYSDLILLGKGEDALETLIRRGRSKTLCFETLCAQLKFKTAFKMLEEADRGVISPVPDVQSEISRAKILALLGEKEAAIQIFRKKFEEFRSQKFSARELVTQEWNSGFKDLVFEQLADFFKSRSLMDYDDVLDARTFTSIIDNGQQLLNWIILFRELAPEESLFNHCQKAYRILEGKESRAKTDQAITALLKTPIQEYVEQQIEGKAKKICSLRFEMQATAYLALNDLIAAEKVFKENLNNPNLQLMYADFLFERERYLEAADQFGLVAQSKRSALAVVLKGICLIRAGKMEEGKKLCELGHWLPLADAEERTALIRGLQNRGLNSEVEPELDLILQLCWPGDSSYINALNRKARLVVRTRGYAGAALRIRKCILGCLMTEMRFIDPSFFLITPESANAFQSLEMLEKGQIPDSVEILRKHLKVLPGDISSVLVAYPKLKLLGKLMEADALWKISHDAYLEVVAEYPKYAEGWNSIAWLNVNCRKDLQEALRCATKAVELEPGNTSYLDTKAESLFCLGQKEKAIELAKACIKIDPRRNYYKRQLARFQTQSPEKSFPEEEDDF
ncbi:hypothetical protein KIH39_01450 [Telmatocola sphagniphila]|uniref:Tetratricopeptide repeat protein n=1 Tax=Telmatocola sphagniphila TaxID=1123043 RepID=A0A8E6B5N9_9BACT|nr:hypothetical protein [Telmatocola sphagniphila]QVL32610.1 hypothetical protein KIH39_01450 [Telmatocola sphagniphila]